MQCMRRPTALEIEFGILVALTLPAMVWGMIVAGELAIHHMARILQ